MTGAAEIIKKYIKGTDRICVAVSGGVDSAVLLHYVINSGLDKKNISVVNFEHGIRGAESKRDSEFVERLCVDYQVDLHYYEADIPSEATAKKISVELAARDFRRRVFKEMLDSGAADYILTAHHKSDLTESVLLHIFRGTGINGLIGINELSGQILRPLLYADKDEILSYAKKHNIKYVTDSTNADTDYDRNYIRNQIIPLIKERWDIDSAILRLSDIAKDEKEFTESIKKDKVKLEKGTAFINKNDLKNGRYQSYLYINEALRLIGINSNLEKKHYDLITQLAYQENGTSLDIKDGAVAVSEYDNIAFYLSEDTPYDEVEFSLGITSFLDGMINVSSCGVVPIKGKLCADADKIPFGAVIRTRKEGDIFTPYGGGTKKLKEYLIDKKISKRLRGRIPLLAQDNVIFAVFGIEISDNIKIDKNTVNAVQLDYGDI